MHDALPLLTAVRGVVGTHAAAPRVLLVSPDLERHTEDAARAAWSRRVPFAALCADLGRVAVECLPHDRCAAVAVGQAMTRWAAARTSTLWVARGPDWWDGCHERGC